MSGARAWAAAFSSRALRPRHGQGFFRQTTVLRCTFQSNLTSLTNQCNRDEQFLKFGNRRRSMGIARISRLQVRPISVLHETAHVTVVGRNFCNGFDSNQFLLVNKQTKRCVFVDACDDWPDDWATFLSSAGLVPTHVFLTHCHIDNIVNLNALLCIVGHHLGVHMGLMWCPAERVWVDAFPRACERYGRVEECAKPLPLLQTRMRGYVGHASEPSPRAGSAALGREKDVLLSCGTNRATSFFELGEHSVLHYLFTPGHSPGHMMLSLPCERLLFTGDVLCYNQVGRVDLPWATGERLAESLLALEDFPDNTVVLPGHGRLTTLGRERRENRALRVLYERRSLGQRGVSVGFNQGYL